MDEKAMWAYRPALIRYGLRGLTLAAVGLCAGCGGGGGGGSLPPAGPPAVANSYGIATPTPASAAYMQASAPNVFRGTLPATARTGLIAVLSTAVGTDGIAPASESLSVSLANVGPSAFERAAAQALGATNRAWAADVLHAGSPASTRSAIPAPPFSDARPDDRYLTPLSTLAKGARRSFSSLPEHRSARSVASQVGATSSFWVSKAAIGTPGGSYAAVPATLRASFAHSSIWVDDTLGFDASSLERIGVDFENAYESDTRHFGTLEYAPDSPGARLTTQPCNAAGNPISGAQPVPMLIPPPNGRHVVLIVNQNNLGAGLGGYFSALNFLPQQVANCLAGQPPSNETSMIVIAYAPGSDLNYTLQEDFVRSTAHELQHAVNFVAHFVLAQNPQNEEPWINEGLSMLAQDFAVSQLFGGTPNVDVDDALAHAQQYLSYPEGASLTSFSGASGSTPFVYNSGSAYGNSYLFVRYLYDRFGGDAFSQAVESGSAVGAANLRAATGIAAETLIGDYGVALAVGGLGITTDPRFNFTAFKPYGTYTDQFNRTMTLQGPAVTVLAAGSNATYAAHRGTFRYFSTQPGAGQGAGVTIADAAGGLQLTPALIQR